MPPQFPPPPCPRPVPAPFGRPCRRPGGGTSASASAGSMPGRGRRPTQPRTRRRRTPAGGGNEESKNRAVVIFHVLLTHLRQAHLPLVLFLLRAGAAVGVRGAPGGGGQEEHPLEHPSPGGRKWRRRRGRVRRQGGATHRRREGERGRAREEKGSLGVSPGGDSRDKIAQPTPRSPFYPGVPGGRFYPGVPRRVRSGSRRGLARSGALLLALSLNKDDKVATQRWR